MMTISIAEAKAKLPSLVKRAEAGEEIVLTRHGRPVARIIGGARDTKPSLLGAMRGRIEIAEDFDELPLEFMSHFDRERD